MNFTPAVMFQAEDRAHRIGQKHISVNVHYLFGADTVDETIFPQLQEKFAVVSVTLDNKKMDMEVQKLKNGKHGDIGNNSTNVSKREEDDENTLKLVTFTSEKKRKKGKDLKVDSKIKNTSLFDYFKPKDKETEDVSNISGLDDISFDYDTLDNFNNKDVGELLNEIKQNSINNISANSFESINKVQNRSNSTNNNIINNSNEKFKIVDDPPKESLDYDWQNEFDIDDISLNLNTTAKKRKNESDDFQFLDGKKIIKDN